MKKLQEVTDCMVMGAEGCLDALGWSYKKTEEGFNDITCCDKLVNCSGFIGTEVLVCDVCGKEMLDLFSPIRTGNSTVTILDPKEYEYKNGEHWIAIDSQKEA